MPAKSEASAVDTARRIADDILFVEAAATDAAPLVSRANLDALAHAGLYGIVGPPEYGGLGADVPAWFEATEVIASGCLTTAFVWSQHFGALWAIVTTEHEHLRKEWLHPLCTGERRAGIAISALRPGPTTLHAVERGGRWFLRGTAPWVTGWGRIDVIHVAARTDDGRVVWSLIDAAAGPSLAATPLALIATNASGTVELLFEDYEIASDRIVRVQSYEEPPVHDGGGRLNGSLALGVAARCCRLIGDTNLREELIACRAELNTANEHAMALARAVAVELALRCAATLVAQTGSRAVLADSHAHRLAREATFLLVFGTRPAIRSALLGLLTDRSRRRVESNGAG